MPRAPLPQFIIALALATLAVTAMNAAGRYSDRMRDAENARAELAIARQEARAWLQAHPIVTETRR